MIQPHACPACGQPSAAFGESFCGPCEVEFWAEQAKAEHALREECAAKNAKAEPHNWFTVEYDGGHAFIRSHCE